MKEFVDIDWMDRLFINSNVSNPYVRFSQNYFEDVDTNLTTKDIDENSDKFSVVETNEWTRLGENDIYVEFLKQKFPKTFEHTMNQFNEWKYLTKL